MELLKFENTFIQKSYLTISILGKSYKLDIKYIHSNTIELIKDNNSFKLLLPKKYTKTDNIEIINYVIQKLYSQIAPKELEDCMELVRYIVKFAPEDYSIERLNNSFYKINKNKILIINPDIIQFNKDIIINTLLQAFCKIKYKSNTKSYKNNLMIFLQKYENYKNQLKNKDEFETYFANVI